MNLGQGQWDQFLAISLFLQKKSQYLQWIYLAAACLQSWGATK